MQKIGTVTVSVYKDNNQTLFKVETNNDNVLPVAYIIDDTLKLY